LEIAIIGMAGRFPGADDLDGFWRNLRDGIESIASLADEPAGANPRMVQRAGLVREPEYFDAELFGYPPQEAVLLDPQVRMLLELSWHALEDSGHDPERFGGPIGVFAGTTPSDWAKLLAADAQIAERADAFQIQLATGGDFVATRIAYDLGLSGPAYNIQTACSTSLVALHVACQSLLAGDCDLALTCAASLRFPQRAGMLAVDGFIAPDGRCYAFDARARGIVRGDGGGILVLRRLADAVRDGDRIRAVIKGSATNNDGGKKLGFAAPSVGGQAAVIAAAQRAAGVEAEDISYVEAHGTGTALGDPVEVSALTDAFRVTSRRTGFCALGSVKTNIGHLDTAAGMAGVIKTVLALEHREIPPSLHFERANPNIDFAASPFTVNTSLRPWPNGAPRRAGVSSFGIGGTNAHIIIEEAPPPGDASASVDADGGWQILPVSAHNQRSLDELVRRLVDWLRVHGKDIRLGDLAYTLQVGRRELAIRRAVVCRDVDQAIAALSEPGEGPGDAGDAADGAWQDALDRARRWLRGERLERPSPERGRRHLDLPLYPMNRARFAPASIDQAAEAPSAVAAPAPAPAAEATTVDRIRAVWQAVLGCESIGIDDDFYDLGGDSLIAMTILEQLASEFGFEISLADYLAATTPRKAAALVIARRGAAPGDMRRDAQLDDSIRFSPTPATGDAVLVTGATGMLGAHVVAELLAATRRPVLCLVRPAHGDPHRALGDAWRRFGLERLLADERVVAVAGDLTQPDLGIGQDSWAGLARRVRAIYHCAGRTAPLASYVDLFAANVDAATAVLRLAGQAGAELHHVSTTGVFGGHDGVVKEAEYSDGPDGLPTGYDQTKWVAEQLVRQAQRRGLRVSIYRLALLLASSHGGALHPEDGAGRLLRVCAKLGVAPDLHPDPIAAAPVDHVARALVRLSLVGGAAEHAHLLGGRKISKRELFDPLRRRGHRIEPIDHAAFVERVLAAASGGDYDDAVVMQARIIRAVQRAPAATRHPLVDDALTHARLHAGGAPWPALEPSYFDRYAAAAVPASPPTLPGSHPPTATSPLTNS
jgi:thioester reductase-like protein